MYPTLHRACAAIAVILLATPWASVRACPFCSRDGRTLSSEVQDAAFVVYGRLANPRVTPNADGTETSSTELHIEEVLKPHDYLKDKKVVMLPRYLPPIDEKQSNKCVIFCYYYQGRVDPYLMFAVKDQSFLAYLRGSLGKKQEDRMVRLKFFFDHLDNANNEISMDAYREFAFASYKEVREMTEKYREPVRTKLLHWFQNRDAQLARLGLFGMMLGLCGQPGDGYLIRDAVLDQQVVTGIDGMLAGYVMLNRKEGWALLEQTLKDRRAPFHRRHAALRTVKFFLKDHPGIVAEREIWSALGTLLDDTDLADIAMNDLRHAKHWSHLDRILDLEQQPSHQTPLIRKAILQYTLQCPLEKAKQYVTSQRRVDPKRVQAAEEDLLYDQPPP